MTPSKSKAIRLGELQLRIMKILWKLEEATVSEVHERLDQKSRLAYTTVATMLRKMERRGLVAHRSEERRFIYRAVVDSDEVSRSMAGDVLERLFEGRLSDMVSHLLSTRKVSQEELRRLEKLIREKKRPKGPAE